MVQFPKRSVRRTTVLGHGRIWYSRCGQFRIVKVRPWLCKDAYRAETCDPFAFWLDESKAAPDLDCAWYVIGRHRRRTGARKACEKYSGCLHLVEDAQSGEHIARY